jgi:hypothetical protein
VVADRMRDRSVSIALARSRQRTSDTNSDLSIFPASLYFLSNLLRTRILLIHWTLVGNRASAVPFLLPNDAHQRIRKTSGQARKGNAGEGKSTNRLRCVVPFAWKREGHGLELASG